jgi:hypothetical protein
MIRSSELSHRVRVPPRSLHTNARAQRAAARVRDLRSPPTALRSLWS